MSEHDVTQDHEPREDTCAPWCEGGPHAPPDDQPLDLDAAEAMCKARRADAESYRWVAERLINDVRDARSRIAVSDAERDEARAWVRRLTATQRVLTCVYCGEAYPPGAPTHGAEVLTAHVRTCTKHPLNAALGIIRTLLDSATPHPKEHPAMTKAWAKAREWLTSIGADK